MMDNIDRKLLRRELEIMIGKLVQSWDWVRDYPELEFDIDRARRALDSAVIKIGDRLNKEAT